MNIMAKKRKDKPPSRKKYEVENPTVSARVTQKTRARLYKNLAVLGMSLADAIKVLAGELEVKARPIAEVWQTAFAAGKEYGSNETKRRYAISYKCAGCGEEILVSDDNTKQAIVRFLRDHHAGHVECLKKRGWI
jgi:hypothetical protein